MGDSPPVWSGLTLELSDSRERRLVLTRYRLRALAHRIVADCERMLDLLDAPERGAWREAVGAALLAGRHLLRLIVRDHGRAVSDPDAHLAELSATLRDPQRQVLEAMSTVMGFVPTDAEDELLTHDARGVRDMAASLWATEEVTTTVRASGAHRLGRPERERRARLLVADDEKSQRTVLHRLLDRLGYDVVEAANGLEALAETERGDFDLILSDLTMPGLDGVGLLKRLKASERTREVPVIIISGDGDIQSVVKCIEHGAEDHVTKPFELALLQARIRASLERKRMRDQELAYLGRVGMLSAAAEAVEQETYIPGSLDPVAGVDDELGRLARVFDRMVTGIRTREERLQRRLAQLRRDIKAARSGSAEGSASWSLDSPFVLGQVINGRYEIKSELGKGGMGMVYRALDRELGYDIAIKVVRGDLVSQNPSLVDRLKSEIRLARLISHRNVVRTHDLGEWKGTYFLTMEYVKGISVDDMLNMRGALSVESTLAIGTQLADALAVAHEAQVIHRDIKPANLLVDESGTLKVTDFGLARMTERDSGGITGAGVVVGTPGYMAPEQHYGGAPSASSDLFSVGVVLYECLTGRPPFDAGTTRAVIDKVLQEAPQPIRSLAPHVPGPLAAIIEQLLTRDPAARASSARELSRRLTDLAPAQERVAAAP